MMMVLIVVVLAAVVAVGWRRRRHAEQFDDVHSVVVPGPEGSLTIVVSNPASEPAVVTAWARPFSRVPLLAKGHVRRTMTGRERSNSERAARQLLGPVPAGDQAMWVVIGDATTSRVCRVILSIYGAGGRVRVHEHLVNAKRMAVGSGMAGQGAIASFNPTTD